MPMENMVHMFGGTKKKSTLVDERVIQYTIHILLIYTLYSFPREDEGSPRQKILDMFCQAEVKLFRTCMTANNYDENRCLETKGILDKCSSKAFKKANSETEFTF